VERLIAVRGREEGKPILVLVADVEMVGTVAASIPPAAARLARRFWPGPLTLVLPARPGLPSALTAGTGTIGVRVPGSDVAAALVAAHGGPLTAPSANPPGAAAPRALADARAYFGGRVDAYVDGGTLPGGASTVAAIDGPRVRVLRDGPISASALRAALAES
jgi:L-threonylcarbamoyladenylate synthase